MATVQWIGPEFPKVLQNLFFPTVNPAQTPLAKSQCATWAMIWLSIANIALKIWICPTLKFTRTLKWVCLAFDLPLRTGKPQPHPQSFLLKTTEVEEGIREYIGRGLLHDMKALYLCLVASRGATASNSTKLPIFCLPPYFRAFCWVARALFVTVFLPWELIDLATTATLFPGWGCGICTLQWLVLDSHNSNFLRRCLL